MTTKNVLSIVILCCLSLISGIIGDIHSRDLNISLSEQSDRLHEVDRDGWINQYATITLDKLPIYPERIILTFDSWRPKGLNPAEITAKLCDIVITQTIIPADPTIKFNFPNNCQGDLTITVNNPFKAEDRILGVKFVTAALKQAVSIKSITKSCFAANGIIFVISLLLYMLLSDSSSVSHKSTLGIATLIAIFSGYLLSLRTPDSSFQLFFLALTTLFILAGSVCAPLFKESLPKCTNDRQLTYYILVVIIAALAIRIYGINFGLPESFHPDEPRKAKIALRMIETGSLDPNYFLHPSLLIYLTALATKFNLLVGIIPELSISNVQLSGRLVSAVSGTLAVWLTYLIGSNLISRFAGLASAAILAFAPLSVTCSRYLKEDSLLTLFILATTYFALCAVQKNDIRKLLIAAFCAGLAASSKYSGALSAIIILTTPWLKSQSIRPDLRFLKWSILSLILVPIGFLFGTPYAVLNYPKFIEHLTAERNHMEFGHFQLAITPWSQYWAFHLSTSIWNGLTWAPTLIALFSIGLFVRKRNYNLIFVVFAVLAFYLPAEYVNAKPPPQPERYILPVIPFLAIMCGGLLDLISATKFKFIAIPLSIYIISICGIKSLDLAENIYPDSRITMANWINSNIGNGASILIDSPHYSATLDNSRFKISRISTPDEQRGLTANELRKQGIEYLLITNKAYDRYLSYRSPNPILKTRYLEIIKKWELVHSESNRRGEYGFHNPRLNLYKVP